MRNESMQVMYGYRTDYAYVVVDPPATYETLGLVDFDREDDR